MKNLALASALTLVVCGCESPGYVVQRDIPLSPNFSVVPANPSLDEATFANEVERVMISCGFSVVDRPPLISSVVARETTSPGTERTQDLDAMGFSSVWLVEYRQVTSTFLVRTYRGSRQTRVIRVDGREVVASLDYDETGRDGQVPRLCDVGRVLLGRRS